MGFSHYVIFGDSKMTMTPEEAKKAWTEYGKALQKVNMKLTGPFGPFGVKEGVAFILEGTIEDFEKYISSDAFGKCPITNTRTVSLYKMPWV